jgi:hypothetical protein
VVLALPAEGASRDLPIAWPAAFDASGGYAYSPSWLYRPDPEKDPGAPAPVTTIVEVASGAVVATLSGAPPDAFLWTDDIAVAGTGESFLAVLQGADGCDGTAIYRGTELVQCIDGGVEGQIGPGGLVAVARDTGPTGPLKGFWGESSSGTSFAVDVVRPDGSVQTVVEDSVSPEAAPMMTWNEAGTHLLIQWPRFVGL